MYNKTQFPNGLRLVTRAMPHMDSASVGIWIQAGGRYESKENKGIAHVLEHMSFKGSKKYSLHKIKETIEGLGGSLNAFTSEECTCYLTKILAKHLTLAMKVLADMVLNPKLSPADLEKEKPVIIEEIKMYRDLPQSYVYELLDELFWPGHPLGMNLAGTIETVSALEREQLSAFHQEFYQPGAIAAAVCGNIRHNEIEKHLSLIFSCAHRKPAVAFKKADIQQDEPNINLFYKQTEQSHLAMGYRAFSRTHPDRHALGLLHIILGANMSSRLFNEIREKKGLAYEIGTQVKRLNDTGAFIIHAGVDNHKVHLVVGTILKEIAKISKELVTKGEFTRAKEYYTSQLLMALEDTLDHMLWMGEQEISTRKVQTIKEVLAEIDKVEIEDLKRVAGQLFSKKYLCLALIGPQKEADRAAILKALEV